MRHLLPSISQTLQGAHLVLGDFIVDAGKFREQFDEDGYVILRDFIPIQLMDNAQVALERIIDALAEQRVANGDIPHAFKDEPFELRFKKLFENEPDSGLI